MLKGLFRRLNSYNSLDILISLTVAGVYIVVVSINILIAVVCLVFITTLGHLLINKQLRRIEGKFSKIEKIKE